MTEKNLREAMMNKAKKVEADRDSSMCYSDELIKNGK